MCYSASFVQTSAESKPLWSVNGDSHTQIMHEHGVRDTGDVAKYELIPPDKDYSKPFEDWLFSIDGDKPTWCDAEDAENQCRKLLPTWALSHFVTDGDAECKEGQTRFAFGKAKLKVSGGEAWFYDQSQGTVSGGVASFYGNSQGTVSGGVARFYDQSQGTVSGGEARFYGQSKRL